MGLRRRIGERGISIGLMGFVAVFALACAALGGVRHLSGWVNHTHEAINGMNRIQVLVERAEAAARGFVLTRNPEMLVGARRIHRELESRYDQLFEIVADNKQQQDRLNEARTAYDRRAREIEGALLRPDGPETLFALESVQELRRLDQDFADEEYRLLAQREASADYLSLAAAFFMTCGLVLAVFFTRTGQAWIRVKASEWKFAREQAEELARIKSDFIATMSHEIRTSIGAIIGTCTQLLDTRLDGAQSSHVQTLHTSAESLLTLVNQVLDSSRIESGRIEIARMDFDPREVFGSALDLFRARATEKGLDLRLVVNDATPVTLRGDAIRLRQVLVNLVSNAVKFTERGHVLVCVELHDDELRVEVEDTGRGIPVEQQSRLFQKYSQLQLSGEGSGLGLMICKGLVEAMDGDIGVESRDGLGSRFWFCARIEEAQGEPQAESNRLEGRVLIAEDHPVNQAVIRKYVESFGMTATVVPDGQAAVDAVREGEFDLVLMDCQMPVMDGFSAAWLIRCMATKRHVPILALTATGTQADRERSVAVGMNDYLIKPIEAERLRAAIQRHLVRPDEFEPKILDRLRGFQSGSRSLITALREDMAKEGPRTLDRMDAAVRAADLSALSQLAHGLKSAGRALGLAHVGRLCEQIEHAPTSDHARIVELREAMGRGTEWLGGAEV